MDQHCPRANRLSSTTEAKVEAPAALKASNSSRFGMPRPPVTNTGRRRNTVVAHLGSEVNAMTPTYSAKVGIVTRKTNVGAQKINGSALVTYGMVIAVGTDGSF